MQVETYIIVADKFADFTVNQHTVTLSHFKALLSLPCHLQPETARLMLGQGISDDDRTSIVALIEGSARHRLRWDIDALHKQGMRATAQLSHKRNPCNTLIGSPEVVDENTFRLDLFIDQNCELMNDHQTGQHVQGMVLVEAARQSFLAVTEKYFLLDHNRKSYFVINEMRSAFLGFVFPLPAHMEYRVLSKNINDRRQRFDVEVDLIQASEVRVRTAISFTAYPDEVISEKEAGLAIEAVAHVRSACQPVAVAA